MRIKFVDNTLTVKGLLADRISRKFGTRSDEYLVVFCPLTVTAEEVSGYERLSRLLLTEHEARGPIDKVAALSYALDGQHGIKIVQASSDVFLVIVPLSYIEKNIDVIG